MIEHEIAGRGVLRLQHSVTDMSGTPAADEHLMDGMAANLLGLSDRLQIHLPTAETSGRQEMVDRQLGLKAVRIPAGGEALMAADVVAPGILEALDLLYQPLRLVATLRR